MEGKGSLDVVEYGKSYRGFAEPSPASPLSINATYRVFAKELPRFGTIGYAATYFRFDENGMLIKL